MASFFEDVARDIRHAWRLLRRDARIHGHGDRRAGDQHRREHRGLLGDQLAAAAAASLSRRGSHRPGRDHARSVEAHLHARYLDPQVHRMEERRPHLQPPGGLPSRRSGRQPRGRWSARAPLGAARLAGLLQRVRRARAPRTRLQGAGRQSAGAARRRPRPRLLDAALRRQSVGRRPRAAARRARRTKSSAILAGDFRPDPPVDVYLPLRADTFSLDFANVIRVAGRMHPNITVARAAGQLSHTTPGVLRQVSVLDGAVGGLLGGAAAGRDGRRREASAADAHAAPSSSCCSSAARTWRRCCSRAASAGAARSRRATALGAQRFRVVRQLLTESGLLAHRGGVLGLAAGVAGLRAIVRAAAEAIPSLARQEAAIALDPNVVWFTVAVSLATGVLFGVLPALTSSRVDLSSAFKDAGTSAEGGWRRHRTQSALVVLEMTLAIVLLVGCGLMVRTLDGAQGRRSRIRSAPRDGARHVAQRHVAPADRRRRVGRAHRAAAHGSGPWRRRLRGLAIPAARTRLRAAVHDRSAVGQIRVRRHGRVAGHLVRILRRLPDPGAARTRLRRARRPRGPSPSSSSTRRWRGATGKRTIRSARRSRSARPPDPSSAKGRAGSSALSRTHATRRPTGIPKPTVYVPLAQVSDAMTARNNRLFPLTWAVRTEIEPRLMRGPIERELRAATGGLPVARTRTMEEVLAGPARRAAFHVTLMSVVRGGGAAAGGRRVLRPDVVLGAAAHAGDRDPHGARRGPGGRPQHGPARRACAWPAPESCSASAPRWC